MKRYKSVIPSITIEIVELESDICNHLEQYQINSDIQEQVLGMNLEGETRLELSKTYAKALCDLGLKVELINKLVPILTHRTVFKKAIEALEKGPYFDYYRFVMLTSVILDYFETDERRDDALGDHLKYCMSKLAEYRSTVPRPYLVLLSEAGLPPSSTLKLTPVMEESPYAAELEDYLNWHKYADRHDVPKAFLDKIPLNFVVTLER